MTNFRIDFTNPWLLLLLVPALFFTFLPYFKLAKKYRRTRNRVISVALHATIMVLSVCLLAGIGFSYDLPNTQNELLLVVDASFSGRRSQEERDEFVRTVIEEAGEGVQVGVVTFGYDQVYAVPLSTSTRGAYSAYLDADLPDVSASDIASALKYAHGLFTYPETAKIVLVSDGEETDKQAMTEIRSIAATGTSVDTYRVYGERNEDEIQMTSVEFPEETAEKNKSFNMKVSLTSNYADAVTLVWYDNGARAGEKSFDVYKGAQTTEITHTFTEDGLHSLYFELTSSRDTLTNNNTFTTYKYLDIFEDILVIEKYANESQKFRDSFDGKYNFTVVQTDDSENMPKTADELSMYDQVVLANVANADLPEGFDVQLNKYVQELGGGLFTFGGNKQGTDEANAYNHEDLKIDPVTHRTPLLQEMLPVQAVEYTPPAGVVFVIDISGSMSDKLDAAKAGVLACVQELSTRDYVGIFTLDDTYGQVLKLTPKSQISNIEEAIMNITLGGNTNYTSAIKRAGLALSSLNVQVKRIIVVSDGQPGDPLWSDAAAETGGYGAEVRSNKEKGISCSFVSIGSGSIPAEIEDLKKAAEIGGGAHYRVNSENINDLTSQMASDLKTDEVKQYRAEPFTPKVAANSSILFGIDEATIPQLGGYYGTRLKSKATAILTDPYNVPVYAQWSYGNGKVGSFLCDLNGTWSSEFLADATGKQLLENMVQALFPVQSIKPQAISVKIEEDNYSSNMSIFTKTNEGDKVRVTVSKVGDSSAFKQILEPLASEGFSRVTFQTKEAGVYEVLVEKTAADGSIVKYTTYRAFSYSEEYDEFKDEEEGKSLMKRLAESGGGKEVEEAWKVYDTFERSVHREYDPRLPMAIAVIVLFLADVAVRKFKFKWIHEIVADKKAKRLAREKREGA